MDILIKPLTDTCFKGDEGKEKCNRPASMKLYISDS
jgi:hypothetical protein